MRNIIHDNQQCSDIAQAALRYIYSKQLLDDYTADDGDVWSEDPEPWVKLCYYAYMLGIPDWKSLQLKE